MMYRPDKGGKRSGLLGQKGKARERHLPHAHKAERGGETVHQIYFYCSRHYPMTEINPALLLLLLSSLVTGFFFLVLLLNQR
jgi:hypothetical protein